MLQTPVRTVSINSSPLPGPLTGTPREALDLVARIVAASPKYSIIGMDLAGTIILWNEGARQLYGHESGEVVGRANASIINLPADVLSGKHRKSMAGALRDGKWEGVLGHRRKNGELFTARIVVIPRCDSSGNAMGFLLISRDISDEIRLTEELKAAQSYARSLIEASPDPFFTISPEGKITDLNEAAVQVTGLGREKLLGTDFADYFTDSEKARKGQQEVLSRGFIRDYSLAICHVVGWVTDVLCSASVYKDENGTVGGVFAAFRGVTERKMAKKATRTSSAYARNWSQSRAETIGTSAMDG